MPRLPSPRRAAVCRLGLLSTLPASLLEQLLMLVLAHLLAPLLDDRTHRFSCSRACAVYPLACGNGNRLLECLIRDEDVPQVDAGRPVILGHPHGPEAQGLRALPLGRHHVEAVLTEFEDPQPDAVAFPVLEADEQPVERRGVE